MLTSNLVTSASTILESTYLNDVLILLLLLLLLSHINIIFILPNMVHDNPKHHKVHIYVHCIHAVSMIVQ